MNRNMHEYRRIFLYFEDAWVKSKDKKQRFNNFFNDECLTDPNLQILFYSSSNWGLFLNVKYEINLKTKTKINNHIVKQFQDIA